MSCPCHQALSGQSFGLARLVAPLAACLDVMEGDRREQAGPCWALLGKSLPKRAWKSTADEAASLTPARLCRPSSCWVPSSMICLHVFRQFGQLVKQFAFNWIGILSRIEAFMYSETCHVNLQTRTSVYPGV